jgi:hypothetical protein
MYIWLQSVRLARVNSPRTAADRQLSVLHAAGLLVVRKVSQQCS